MFPSQCFPRVVVLLERGLNRPCVRRNRCLVARSGAEQRVVLKQGRHLALRGAKVDLRVAFERGVPSRRICPRIRPLINPSDGFQQQALA